jgi:hypothetical protein
VTEFPYFEGGGGREAAEDSLRLDYIVSVASQNTLMHVMFNQTVDNISLEPLNNLILLNLREVSHFKR